MALIPIKIKDLPRVKTMSKDDDIVIDQAAGTKVINAGEMIKSLNIKTGTDADFSSKSVFFEVRIPTSTLVIPGAEKVYSVPALYVASARQGLNYGYTYSPTTSTITLAERITQEDIDNTEEGFILVEAVCVTVEGADITSLTSILASSSGASHVGTSFGTTVEEKLKDLDNKVAEGSDTFAVAYNGGQPVAAGLNSFVVPYPATSVKTLSLGSALQYDGLNYDYNPTTKTVTLRDGEVTLGGETLVFHVAFKSIEGLLPNAMQGFSFQAGARLGSVNDHIYDPETKSWWFWTGGYPKTVNAGDKPEGNGWSLLADSLTIRKFPTYMAAIGDATLKIGDVLSTGRGLWRVKNLPVSRVTDLSLLIEPSLYDFGAKGGDSAADSLAFYIAFGLNIPFKIPAVTFDKAFVVSGELETPRVSRMSGEGVAVSPYQTTLTSEDIQPWVTFADENSRFTIGRSTAVRSFLYWDNIAFVSHVGIAPADDERSGMAIGNKTGFDAAAGGSCSNLSFYGFEMAFRNDWSYYFNVDKITVVSCNYGIYFDDWNASSISNFLSTATKFPIDTGFDSAQSSLRNIGINMSKQTQIGVRCSGGVSFDGYCYFESIGDLPMYENQTCIAYQVTRFSNRPFDFKNILFDARNADYLITFDGVNENLGNFFVAGKISTSKFVAPKKSKIGFGIHPDRLGRPTYPNLIVNNIELSTCDGLSLADLLSQENSPYKVWNLKPVVNYLVSNVLIDISSSSFVRLPISKTVGTITTNMTADGVVTEDGRVKIVRKGYYEIAVTAVLRNSKPSVIEKADVQVRLNDTTVIILGSTIANIPGVGHVYKTVSSSCIIPANVDNYISIRAANGDSVYGYALSVNYVSES